MTRTFDITAPLPAPGSTTVLEASAGTGKTWTIAALVTRYVAEGVATLPELLVVTFGRAASQELRSRVRERLSQAHATLQDPAGVDPRDPLLAFLLEAPEDEVARRRDRLRAALTDIDAATIATTHQFCQLVLRSLGVAGDSDTAATLVEDLTELRTDVADDLYLRGFARDGNAVFTRSVALEIARRAVEDSHAALEPVAAEPGSVASRRMGYARRVREEMDRRKRRLGVLHYQDLLTQVANALQDADGPARRRMRTRWSVVLVDEFQDTDPVQWQVLDRAFSGHATMVLIGDPKQAIYAFRGGDVATYLTATAGADAHQTLATNHRSDAPLVEALQRVLRGAALGDPEILVHPVSAQQQTSRLAGAPHPEPLRLRVVGRAQVGGAGGTKPARIGPVREYVARDAARDIAALLGSRATFDGSPLLPEHVAVLAHTGTQLGAVQRALRGLGIPAVLAGGGSVFHTLAAAEWLTLLQALVTPHRATRTRAAALTSLIGHTPAELDAGGDELTDRLATRMRTLADIVQSKGVAAVTEAARISGLAARVLATTDGERHLTDLHHVGQLLHDVGSTHRLGLLALTDWLTEQIAADGAGGGSARTRRLDSDAAAVQLATIHGSKGLQYPVVYLPFMLDRFVRDPSIALFHTPAPERRRCLDVGGQAANPLWHEHLAAHQSEDAGESLRLLYVALTRAQSQVVTWWAPSTNTAASPWHRLLFGRGADPGAAGAVPDTVRLPDDEQALRHLVSTWSDSTGPGLHLEVADPVEPPALAAPVDPADLQVRRFGRPIDTSWRRTSYTALSTPLAPSASGPGGVGSEPEVAPKDDEPDAPEVGADDAGEPVLPGLAVPGDLPSPMAGLPVGARFGSLVHAVLEHTDPAAPDLPAQLVEQIRAQQVWWPVGLEQEDVEALAHALVAVLDTPLGPLAGSSTLRLLGTSHRMCELDFELPLTGGDQRGHDDTDEPPRLGDLAPLLRRHLPDGDPVRGYADALDQPELGAQELRGYLTGSIDVVLRLPDGRYLVVDYKTNWLGPLDGDVPLTAASYRPEALTEAMGHSSYPLQALLYAVVAHRFLRWRLAGYNPDQHLGGVLYLYLRGMCGPDTPVVDGHPCGVFSWDPPVALVLAVSDLLDGGEAS